ncbi:hypothetical protein PINS_up006346 [Pythium insidiosum]|nr:hypothetical protein PINS_up006346 [Pythium insidiosum]
MAYCAVIVVGLGKLALNIVTWNIFTGFAFLFSFVFWFFSGYVISVALPTLVSDVAFPYLYTLPEFYLVMYLSLVLCLGRDFLFKAFKREVFPEYYHVLQEHHKRKTDPAQTAWTPPTLRYTPFLADLSAPKPQFEPVEPVSTAAASPPERDRAYTGFAFSTQVMEDRFLNPLRDLVLPVTNVVGTLGRRLARSPRSGAVAGEADGDGDGATPASFEDKIKALPMEQQEVYELQRFQIFAGWGSSMPGHLFRDRPTALLECRLHGRRVDVRPHRLDGGQPLRQRRPVAVRDQVQGLPARPAGAAAVADRQGAPAPQEEAQQARGPLGATAPVGATRQGHRRHRGRHGRRRLQGVSVASSKATQRRRITVSARRREGGRSRTQQDADVDLDF